MAIFREYSKNKQDLPLAELQSFLRIFKKHNIKQCLYIVSDYESKFKDAISRLNLNYNFEHKKYSKLKLPDFLSDSNDLIEHDICESYDYDNLLNDVLGGFIYQLVNRKFKDDNTAREEICKRVIKWCENKEIPLKKFSEYKRTACSGDICQALGYGVLSNKIDKPTAKNFENKIKYHYKKAKAELDIKS